MLICHLSDIHFSSSNSILSKQIKLFDAIKNHTYDISHLLFIVSGDIANTASENEYSIASDFFNSLKKKLIEYNSKLNVSFIFSPGNHDCILDKNDIEVRAMLCEGVINKYSDSIIPDGVLSNLTSKQNNYLNFISPFCLNSLDEGNSLMKSHKIQVDGLSLTVNSFNSSWMSQRNETYGQLYFPLKNLPEVLVSDELVISVLHHNFPWFKNARELKETVEKFSNIILTGHEHISTTEERKNFITSRVVHIEGGELQNHSNEDSSFHLIHINKKDKLIRNEKYSWNNELYNLESDSEWISIKKDKDISNNTLEVRKKFLEFLNDLDAPFKHPRKKDLNLSDIYIYPNLKKLTKDIKNKNFEKDIYNAKSIFENKIEGNYLVIGDERIGKTTLSKILFKNAYNLKKTPIYIVGEDIKNTDSKTFDKLTQKNFLNQYNNEISIFDQCNMDDIIIIIDGIHKSSLNTEGKMKILSDINNKFKNIVIFSDEFFYLEEIVKGKQENLDFSKFEVYRMMEFGHELRHELISAWNSLGCEHNISECDLFNKNKKTKSLLDIIVGKNIVPSFPIFLLTSLQTFETDNKQVLEESSYSYYYEWLITQEISKISPQNDEIDSYYNFLTELAYFMFNKGEREISETEFSEFHIKFISYYDISFIQKRIFNIESIKSDLLKCKFIKENQGLISFKYNYLYYFFTARYLSKNIEEDSIRECIKKMCKNVHLEENANIIIFIVHHKNSTFIIKEIISNMKEVFSETTPTKLEDDITAINNLQKELQPDLIYEEDLDYKKNNLEKHQNSDSELYYKEKENELSSEELDENINISNSLNTGFKYIEITGQILRNYHGSLSGVVKEELCSESYFLTLRALGFFLEILNESMNYLIKDIEEKIEIQKIVEKDKQSTFTKEFIFNLCGMVSTMLIKKMSNHIGNDKLLNTYVKILKSNDYNSFYLMDTSIKLDFFENPPISDIIFANKKFKHNNLSKFILRNLVKQYLYMFPVKHDIRQKLCSELEITLNTKKIPMNLGHQKK